MFKPINKLPWSPKLLQATVKGRKIHKYRERITEEDYDEYLEDGKLIDEIIKGCEDMDKLSPEARYRVPK